MSIKMSDVKEPKNGGRNVYLIEGISEEVWKHSLQTIISHASVLLSELMDEELTIHTFQKEFEKSSGARHYLMNEIITLTNDTIKEFIEENEEDVKLKDVTHSYV